MEIFTLLALGALFLQILFARHTLERRFDMLERELTQLKRLLKETYGLPKEQKEPAEMQPKAPEEAAEAISAPIYKEVKEEVIPSEPLVEIPVQPAFEPVEEQLAMAAEPVNEKAEQSVEPLTVEPAAMVQQSPAVQQTPSTDSEAPQSVPIETTEKQKEPMNYEKFIGENLFGKIGILVFILGIGFFVKYAIDRNWINETLRTVLGFAVGTGMLLLAQRLNNRYKAFSSLLAGGGCAVFYLTVAIAFHYYQLFSATSAFLIMVGITVLMSVISVFYNRRELAGTALVGGFLAPFIASTGQGNYLILFTYIAILNFGMLGLAFYKRWSELSVISFVFTYGILSFFNFPYSSTVPLYVLCFQLLFFLIFAFSGFYLLQQHLTDKWRPLLIGVFGLGGFISLFLIQENGWVFGFNAGGCTSLFIALVYIGMWLWQYKRAQGETLRAHITLGLAVTFASLAIPLFFNGKLQLLFWAAELVLLLRLYLLLPNKEFAYGTAIIYSVMGLNLFFYLSEFDWLHVGMFFSGSFFTLLFVGAAYIIFAYLMDRNQEKIESLYSPWNEFSYIIGVACIYLSFFAELDKLNNYANASGSLSAAAILAFTTFTLLVVSYAFRHRFSLNKYPVLAYLLPAAGVLLYMRYVLKYGTDVQYPLICLLQWLAAAFIVVLLVYVTRSYYRFSLQNNVRFTVFLNVVATLQWVLSVRMLLLMVGVYEFSAGMSLAVGVAAFVQMYLGMQLHKKSLRIVSIAFFGLVLLKLGIYDVWRMPALGRIIVFTILGLLLLTLSFLYQKLKDALFGDDE